MGKSGTMGKVGYRILTPNELALIFGSQNFWVQNFTIIEITATAGATTDTDTPAGRHTDDAMILQVRYKFFETN